MLLTSPVDMYFLIVLVISVISARVTAASVIVCSTSFGLIICGIVMYLVQTSQYEDHSIVLDLNVRMPRKRDNW